MININHRIECMISNWRKHKKMMKKIIRMAPREQVSITMTLPNVMPCGHFEAIAYLAADGADAKCTTCGKVGGSVTFANGMLTFRPIPIVRKVDVNMVIAE